MDLSNYVRIGRYDLPEPTRTTAPTNSVLAQEASAVTYNWDTDSLFVVGDGGTSIVQVSKTGALINSMTLAPGSSPQGTDFFDPEGLTYIGGGKFVMTEERDRNAVEFTYAAGSTLARGGALTAHLGTNVGNVGLEGLSYDPLTGGFIFVKEKSPEGVFQTTIDFANDTASNGSASTVNSVNLFDPTLLGVLDIADVYALSNNPALSGAADETHLLILSQESGKVVEVDRAGTVISTLTIVSDPGNPLDVVAQQHEGITMDRDGNLYLVSENGGGDFDHPQLWVYAPSAAANAAPTAVTLANAVAAIDENTSTAARIKVADVSVTDDGLGANALSVSGADAASFEVDSTGLYIKAGVVLDFETKASYSVSVNVDDASVGATPDATTAYTLAVSNIVNENTLPNVYISEVAPWSSGSSPVAADWFEITNNGSSALDITGWKMDDNSNAFANAVALSGVTTIAAGASAIFLESAAPATTIAAFINTWFGGAAPAGVQIGTYTGSGVGLSTGGDAVNVYNSAGVLQANVSFGPSPAGPFKTFNNAAGLNNATISTLSTVGTNGAFAAVNDPAEIGSPGTVGKLFISEVAPWSSGSSPVGADWFEVTNTTVAAIDISGWKMDDSSGSPAAAVALTGVSSIGAGESVIFLETTNLAAAKATFINTWFGGNAPAHLQFGAYTGAGVGLGTGGDAVNLYDATNALRASVTFGASPIGPFATFDNAAGLNNATITTISAAGTNAAFNAVNHTTEIGSPGEIALRNDAPVGQDDSAAGVTEGSVAAVTGNVLNNDTDVDLVQGGGESLHVAGGRAGSEAAGGGFTAVAAATVIAGAYGDLTLNPDGSYSYALDNNRPATVALAEGETATETFTYQVADAQGLIDAAQLSIVVTGIYNTNVVIGTAANETLDGTADADIIKGLAGNDILNGAGGDDVLNGGLGGDRLNGGDGIDTVSYADATSGVSVNLLNGRGAFGEAVGDKLSSIEQVVGSDFDDVFSGSKSSHVVHGGGGADTFEAAGKAGALFGDAGDDVFILEGMAKPVSIDGGDGFDTIRAGADGASLTWGSITGIEAISGDGYADFKILGSGAADTIDLSAIVLTDVALIDAKAGDDVVTGSAGADNIFGGSGADGLNGANGDDVLTGGTGQDVLTGGLGADRFVFLKGDSAKTATAADTITDFHFGGADLIDLSQMDANTLNGAGDDGFAFIGTAAFSNTAGELRYQLDAADAYVLGDVNGDGKADFFIHLAGINALSQADFIL